MATSPVIWVHDHAIKTRAEKQIGSKAHDQVFLYLSLGDEARIGGGLL